VHSFVTDESPIRPPVEFSNRRTNHALVQEPGRISAAGTTGISLPISSTAGQMHTINKLSSRRPECLILRRWTRGATFSCGAGACRFVMQNANIGATGIYWQRSNMSTLTRRACYKCGNVGHYAGEWYSLAHRTCVY